MTPSRRSSGTSAVRSPRRLVLACVVALAAACAPAAAPSPAGTGTAGPSQSGPSVSTPAGSREVIEGVVLNVEGTLGRVGAFTLRTPEGQMLRLEVGRLELDGQAFGADHLREHQATAQPVRATFTREGERRVVVRLEDA